jgi:mono/diheme cytochrome c family protein
LVPAAVSDESLLSAHEKPLGRQPDDQAHYRLLPLGILFFLSGLILFSATYLNRYAGHFDPLVYNETVNPSSGVVAVAKVDPVVLGKKLFNSPGACVTCHQPDGKGLAGTYPPLAGSEWAQGPEARVISIVLDGLHGQVKVEGTTFNAAAMPSFGATGYNWSDEKISAVLTYVRQEWGNKAPAITPAQVAETRSKLGTHDVWTQDELLQVH